MSTDGARKLYAGEAGHSSGAPQLVAVLGVTGLLSKWRAAMSTDGARVLYAGESGHSDGAPQLVAVAGVSGGE